MPKFNFLFAAIIGFLVPLTFAAFAASHSTGLIAVLALIVSCTPFVLCAILWRMMTKMHRELEYRRNPPAGPVRIVCVNGDI